MTGMWTYCSDCGHLVEVVLREGEAQLFRLTEWLESFPCIRPGCKGRSQVRTLSQVQHLQSRGVPIVQLPAVAYYRALFGFGAGVGSSAPLDLVSSLLTTRRIVEVHGEDVGQPVRSVIHKLVLDCGTVLHMASSRLGAGVFYVEPPGGPTCLEVHDERARGEDHTGVSAPDPVAGAVSAGIRGSDSIGEEDRRVAYATTTVGQGGFAGARTPGLG